MRKGASKEEELVKYMSKVPSFLQRGHKLQDNVLNFGVLDWGRLEQWTHKHEKVVESDKIGKPASVSCSSSAGCSSRITQNAPFVHSREQPSSSNSSNSVHLVDFSPIVKPLSQKVSDSIDLHSSVDSFIDGKKETCTKDTRLRSDVKLRSSKYKEKYLGHNRSSCDHESLERGRRKLNNFEGEVLKCSEVNEELKLDTCDRYCTGKQQGIVLLFPKDFSSSESSKEHGRASLDEKSSEYNWGSFSDIFSIDEIHPEDSFTEVPHSCSLGSALELEKVLDLKLDTLIKSQGVEIPVNPSDMPVHHIETIESKIEVATSTTIPKGSMDRNFKHFSEEIHGNNSLHCRLSSGLAKLTRSLSFRESSGQPPLSSTYVTAKSGPAKPEHRSAYTEFQNSNKASFNIRAKVNPFRRLLDPIFRFKVAEQLDERSDDLIVKPAPIDMNEHEPVTIKALLHLTVKSGLPLFKFVVGKNDEIFASTVKSLSTPRKDEMSWLYTFYSVQKISKRSSSKRNHQNLKPSRLVYNVVGQMKVSEPRSPSWCEHKLDESHMVKESVLYNVEKNNADGVTSEFRRNRELAAVVVNMTNAARKSSSFYSEDNLNDDCFSDSEYQKLGQIVVVLPGGDHSLPHDGVPSSLITRWRNGGACDCGGWDIGCKLRILTEKWQQHKYLQSQCDLYDQEAKQNTPFFSLIPLRDGLFSVEYDVQISSLQAFSISVALINSHNPAYSTDATDQVESELVLGSTNASMVIKCKGPRKHAPHPPLSPAGRV